MPWHNMMEIRGGAIFVLFTEFLLEPAENNLIARPMISSTLNNRGNYRG